MGPTLNLTKNFQNFSLYFLLILLQVISKLKMRSRSVKEVLVSCSCILNLQLQPIIFKQFLFWVFLQVFFKWIMTNILLVVIELLEMKYFQMETISKDEVLFKVPLRMILIGPMGSGKSNFLYNFIRNLRKV